VVGGFAYPRKKVQSRISSRLENDPLPLLSVFIDNIHCTCRPHQTKTFSPLAELLPEHVSPELLFLETKWASLMSYGMTSKLLREVLPIDDPVNTFTIRQHVADVAEALGAGIG
jgi:hypothetical protein